MKGNTLVEKFTPPAFPQTATGASLCKTFSTDSKSLPPTVSIQASKREGKSGLDEFEASRS